MSEKTKNVLFIIFILIMVMIIAYFFLRRFAFNPELVIISSDKDTKSVTYQITGLGLPYAKETVNVGYLKANPNSTVKINEFITVERELLDPDDAIVLRLRKNGSSIKTVMIEW